MELDPIAEQILIDNNSDLYFVDQTFNERKHNEKTLFEVAEIQLTYKSKVKASLRPRISGSKDVYEVLNKYWDGNKIEFVEQFKDLLLNRGNKVIGIYEVSSGTATGTLADPKSIFVAALKGNACAVILAH